MGRKRGRPTNMTIDNHVALMVQRYLEKRGYTDVLEQFNKDAVHLLPKEGAKPIIKKEWDVDELVETFCRAFPNVRVPQASRYPVDHATRENVVPTSSKDNVGDTKIVKEEDDVGVTEVLNEVEKKKEPNQIKIENMSVVEVVKTKEFSLTKDNNVKLEVMTPWTCEDVVEATEVMKDDKPVETIDDSSNFKDTSPKVEEQTVVVPAVESAEVEPTEEEGVKVTKAELANVETSIATETEKVSRINEANVAETPEEMPLMIA